MTGSSRETVGSGRTHETVRSARPSACRATTRRLMSPWCSVRSRGLRRAGPRNAAGPPEEGRVARSPTATKRLMGGPAQRRDGPIGLLDLDSLMLLLAALDQACCE